MHWIFDVIKSRMFFARVEDPLTRAVKSKKPPQGKTSFRIQRINFILIDQVQKDETISGNARAVVVVVVVTLCGFACRPGLRRFLAQAATMFEMTIYTAGTSQYADAVRFVFFWHTVFFCLLVISPMLHTVQ